MYAPDTAQIQHDLPTVKIVNARQVNSDTYPSYTQEASPYTHVKGRKAETITIDGVLCKATESAAILAPLAGARSVNTLYNVFLPCSILTCTSNGDHGEIPLGSQWMVDTFVVSRSFQRRSLILFTLTVSRYYPAAS